MDLALYYLVRKMPFLQFQLTPNLLSPVFMSVSPLPHPSSIHPCAASLCLMASDDADADVTDRLPASLSRPHRHFPPSPSLGLIYEPTEQRDRRRIPHPPSLFTRPVLSLLPPPSHRPVSHLSLVIDAPPLRFDAPSHPAPLPRG